MEEVVTGSPGPDWPGAAAPPAARGGRCGGDGVSPGPQEPDWPPRAPPTALWGAESVAVVSVPARPVHE